MKLNKKGKILFGGLIVFIITISVVVILIICNNKNIKLTFEDRLDTLNSFETHAIRRGWIQVQGTNVDLPVLSSTDYISDSDEYKYAWLSGNYIDGENRKVIIGHNVLNVSSKPTTDMTNLEDFEGLMAFVYYGFAKKNLYIKYTDFKTQEEKLYLIYAVGFYDYGYDRGEGLSDSKLIDSYIEKVRENSIYKYDIDVNSDDNIITVKTCTRFFGASGKQQFVIDAREIREDEKVEKYKVSKSEKYKELGL